MLEELLAQNDLVLYDLQEDPDEVRNLLSTKEALLGSHRDPVLSLNQRLNALIAAEATRDREVSLPWTMENEPCEREEDENPKSRL